MVPKRVLFAVVALLTAFAGMAQSADTQDQPYSNAAIFGSASGGELTVLSKTSQHWSGSFGIMTSASRYPFANSGIGTSSNRGFSGSIGGTLIKDRAWFFASAERSNSSNVFGSQFNSTVPQTTVSPSGIISANATANIGSRQTITSTFASQQSTVAPLGTTPFRASTSFLSLNYTGVVSDNMFFTAKVTKSGAQTTAQQ